MPYDELEQKFHALPSQSFAEVSEFFDYIFYKFGRRSETITSESDDRCDESLVARINEACRKNPQERIAQDATVAAMWQAVKHDSW